MNRTEIITIVDTSGSMASIARDAEGGYNAFLAQQKGLAGEARLTAVTFDSVVHSYKTVDLQRAGQFTLFPNGMTALNDAIGTVLDKEGKRIAAEKWADAVIVCIVTDGGENSSREYKTERVKEMITHAEKNGWTFVFLAANQDAFAVGATLGIKPGQTFNYEANSIGTRSAYATMSASVSHARGQGTLEAIAKAAEKLMA